MFLKSTLKTKPVNHFYSTLFVCIFMLVAGSLHAQYTNVYNGTNYSSTRPYNVNIIYFVPNDITIDPTYKKRLSALLLYAQNFYKQNMISNGYGPKTFGLFTESAHPDSVKINVINGAHPSASYPYDNAEQLATEVDDYFTANPTQKTSEHTLVITSVSDVTTANVPFYGMGKICYANTIRIFFIELIFY
jgi:hypothetical protein